MKSIEIIIEGTTPLMCNRYTPKAQMAAGSATRSSIVGDVGTPLEIAEERLYKGVGGEIVVPGPNLFRCIIDGGIYFKAGKSKITTQKSSLISAAMAIPQTELKIVSREGWTVDTRTVRIPSTGGRIPAHRPVFNDWALEFTLEVDEEMIGEKLAREIVDASGKRIGLGDFRPACKGPFGRFVVTQWIVDRNTAAGPA